MIATGVFLVALIRLSPVVHIDTLRVGPAAFTQHHISTEGSAVGVADLNADGHLDLVAAGPALTIFLGNGQGDLLVTQRVPGGENPVDFAMGDLDEDGDVDIVVANHDTDHLTILSGNGHGEFEPAPDSPFRIEVSPHPHAVRLADVDADGHLDLIVDDRHGNGLLVIRGLGAGAFDRPGMLVEVGGDPYRGMAVADLNSDGRLDFVTPNPTSVGIALNLSERPLRFVRSRPLDAHTPFNVGVGDFNGDAKPDVISASGEEDSTVELFLGRGDGSFVRADDAVFELARGAKKVAVGDFDGDGIDDAAVICYQRSSALLIFGGRETISTSGFLPAGEHPWGLAAADLNEDGRSDLVVADDAGATTLVYLSMTP